MVRNYGAKETKANEITFKQVAHLVKSIYDLSYRKFPFADSVRFYYRYYLEIKDKKCTYQLGASFLLRYINSSWFWAIFPFDAIWFDLCALLSRFSCISFVRRQICSACRLARSRARNHGSRTIRRLRPTIPTRFVTVLFFELIIIKAVQQVISLVEFVSSFTYTRKRSTQPRIWNSFSLPLILSTKR